MPCYHPLKGFRSRMLNASGKRSIVFNQNQGYKDMPIELSCGQCIGCRLERSKRWAIRCVHEASLYQNNSFITLTYSNENLPPHNSLKLKDFQDFMKRLRFANGKNIRFFHCGEYGERFSRPHYHACLFNFDFKDKIHQTTANGNKLYISKHLQELWPLGHSLIGNVTFESAAYVARYITKKITGDKALTHYNTINQDTGEILAERKPEYTTMSRRPGIGKGWYDKFKTDLYPDDFVILREKKLKVPKYYDTQFELDNLSAFERIKAQRIFQAKNRAPDNTPERLAVKEQIQEQQLKQLIRKFENET